MPNYKRAVHLFPARVVVLRATVAMVVALVGTAAAAAASSADTGSQNFRGERDLTAAAVSSSADTGSQNFRGERDFGPISAVQPGQTVSAAAPVARYDPGHEHLTSSNGGDPASGRPPQSSTVRPTRWPAPATAIHRRHGHLSPGRPPQPSTVRPTPWRAPATAIHRRRRLPPG